MSVRPALQKGLLTAHVIASVGWVGAVLVYLALGIAALTSDQTDLVTGVYLAMEWAGLTVLVPLAAASLVTGVLQSLTTRWGLWRHYWVIVKLALAVFATVVLVLYTQTLAAFATAARSDAPSARALLEDPSVVVHSVGALIVLGFATILSIYKPAGLTRRGQRVRHAARQKRAVGASR
ncbi:DUF2269 domain-containing protein [Nocardioides aurantiacus]|uniref:DUF2269 domain-containing protein n=1 Tax=Nocardioides aurantiacus TaxID=86796 RepID=UPI00403FA2D3